MLLFVIKRFNSLRDIIKGFFDEKKYKRFYIFDEKYYKRFFLMRNITKGLILFVLFGSIKTPYDYINH